MINPANAALEGGDVRDDRPLLVILFGDQFCSCDDAETLGMSATGPGALAQMQRTNPARWAAIKENS